jgi:hypothetical protein
VPWARGKTQSACAGQCVDLGLGIVRQDTELAPCGRVAAVAQAGLPVDADPVDRRRAGQAASDRVARSSGDAARRPHGQREDARGRFDLDGNVFTGGHVRVIDRSEYSAAAFGTDQI